METLRGFRLVKLALALHGQSLILDFNVDVFRIDGRNVGFQHDFALCFQNVNCGGPGS